MSKETTQRTIEVHGYALRAVREAKGVKPQTLAEILGCDRSYITKIEIGTSRRVSLAFYNSLLRALGVEDHRALMAVAPARDAA